ncbi:MAG TPA: GGDEF domain-containing protein [Pirellulales bacterium]|jgi:diguanylate cyclase|nr:GGDEF domain-containing protein [Pirellulales bacterium]
MESVQDWSALFSPSLMLAVVAALGYWVGRRRYSKGADERAKSRQEIDRALSVAKELETITNRLRKSISSHVPAVAKFNSRLARLEQCDNYGWLDLSDRANELLKPALRLSTEISNAHSAILQQMTQLSLFAELRTDPLTGVSNRRAFDDSLDSLSKQHSRYGVPVSVAMLDIDFFKRVNDHRGHLQGDILLREIADLLRESVRECDMVARYGGEEFAIVMPHTTLQPACGLSERLRASIEEHLPITVSIGVTELVKGDTPTAAIQRADAALYLAKVNGRNCVYVHEGPQGSAIPARQLSTNHGTLTAGQADQAPAAPSHPVATGAPSDLVECQEESA